MRILIVEDDKDLSAVMIKLLMKNHLDCELADNGLDALDLIDNHSFDCVILDWMLPKVNGIEVLKETKMRYPKLPVIMLTAKSTIDDKLMGLNGGADDYVLKPFDIKELIARIHAVVRRYTSNSESIEIYQMTLNLVNYELIFKDHHLQLSQKEFMVMKYLMSHPNQLLSSEQIYDQVWGLNSPVDIGIVWVYLSTLRKKLKAFNPFVDIVVIRGIGYRLKEAHLHE